MSDAELIFEEPPNPHAGKGGAGSPITGWLAALREHPGQWAKYPHTVLANTVTAINQAKQYKIERGEFEASSTKAEDGRSWLFARYIGGES